MKSNTILLGAIGFFATLSLVSCSSCENPQVTSKTFTTQDATVVANIAYVSEFEVICRTGALTNLYADVEGIIVPVSVIGPNKFQVNSKYTRKLLVYFTCSLFRSAGQKIRKRQEGVIKWYVFLMKTVTLL